jgi:hypothetical protein
VAALDASIEKGAKMNDTQFEQALKSLSDLDITNYLENNGDITDIAILGNNVDEDLLPNQEDYLLDDKALDKYINSLEISTSKN